MEAWWSGGSTIRKSLVNLLKQKWNENIIPMNWKISVVTPIYKKGDQEKTENYRGISYALYGIKFGLFVDLKAVFDNVDRGKL